MKKVLLAFILVFSVLLSTTNVIYASQDDNFDSSIVMESKKYFETKIVDDEEVVNEVSEVYATKKVKANKAIIKLSKAYEKFKDDKTSKDEISDAIAYSVQAIFELVDAGGGGGGSSNTLYVNYDVNTSTTEVEIDEIYSRVIAYSRYLDGDISQVITRIDYIPESNTNFLLRSTYTTYSSTPASYRDFMAIGYPDYLMPVESTIKWTKRAEFESGSNSFVRTQTGDKFNTIHDDTFTINDNGIIWDVKPYSSYFALIYPVGEIPQYDDNGNYLNSVNLTKSVYELEVKLVTVLVDKIFDDYNMTLWSDYQHTIDKITITFNLNLRAYIGVSSNIGFLGVSATMTQALDKSRRSAIQIIHYN